MSNGFDQHGINNMVAALAHEMTPQSAKGKRDGDVVFLGGPMPTEEDEHALGRFGLEKNYKIVHASFDIAGPAAGPIAFHVVVTDGLTQSIMLDEGRLWKRDRRSPAVLIFPKANLTVKVSAKGRLIVTGLASKYHEDGYELALAAVKARAGWKPGRLPIVSSIENLLVVMDIKALVGSFANAA